MNKVPRRTLSQAEADAFTRLGGGLYLDYPLAGTTGRIRLLPCLDRTQDVAEGQRLRCSGGRLRLTDASAVLSLCGTAPVVFGGAAQPWFWQYFNQNLSSPVAAAFATLIPDDADEKAFEQPVVCHINVRVGDESVDALMALETMAFLEITRSPGWQRLQTGWDENWPITCPVVIGTVSLSTQALQALQPGDIVFPTDYQFDCDGKGSLELGGRTWPVVAQSKGQDLFFHLSNNEK